MDKTAQLKNILDLLSNSVTKSEAIGAIQQVIKIVADHKKQNESEWALIHSAFQMLDKKLHTNVSDGLNDIKKQVDSVFVEKKLAQIESDLHGKVDAKLATVKDGMSIKGDTGKPGKDGAPGKDANEEAIANRVVRRLQPMLKSQVDEVAAKIPKQVQTPAKVYRTNTADLTSQCNGSNKTFSVGGMHFGIVGVYGTEFPQIYRPIIDYTETKTGFTLTSQVSAPATGQTLIALFLK